MRRIGLRQMQAGQKGSIISVDADGELGRRIRDMGLIPGTDVEIVGRARGTRTAGKPRRSTNIPEPISMSGIIPASPSTRRKATSPSTALRSSWWTFPARIP